MNYYQLENLPTGSGVIDFDDDDNDSMDQEDDCFISSCLDLNEYMDAKQKQLEENKEMDAAMEELDIAEVTKRSSKSTRRAHRHYTAAQFEEFIQKKIELDKPYTFVGNLVGIEERTAQRMWKGYKEAGVPMEIPIKEMKKRGRKKILTDEHTAFIINYLDENPITTLDGLSKSLFKEFGGLKLANSTLYNHIQKECRYSLKRARKMMDKKNAEQTLDKRELFAKEWIEKEEEFMYRSVFIDEAGFNLHTIRNVAWSKIGQNANVSIPTEKGGSLSFLGAICLRGVISMSVRLPSHKKKRKTNKRGRGKQIVNGQSKNETSSTKNGKGGTTGKHFFAFVSNVMDILDKNDMKGFNLVMGNASIHHSKGLE
jgi:hypothetical protein